MYLVTKVGVGVCSLIHSRSACVVKAKCQFITVLLGFSFINFPEKKKVIYITLLYVKQTTEFSLRMETKRDREMERGTKVVSNTGAQIDKDMSPTNSTRFDLVLEVSV